MLAGLSRHNVQQQSISKALENALIYTVLNWVSFDLSDVFFVVVAVAFQPEKGIALDAAYDRKNWFRCNKNQ